MPEPAAQLLLGRSLEGGWRVIERAEPPLSASPGYFSVGYVVEHADGRRGFLKALDYSRAFQPGVDRPQVLQALTAAYIYERDLLRRCRTKRLNRVVQILDEGNIRIPGGDPIDYADYLIFELAESDARGRLQALDVAWALRTLHQMAVALAQLHSLRIAHQDVKPANVLVFTADSTKLGDLGRASLQGQDAGHDNSSFPGDTRYAPPEFLYGYISTDWQRRRIGGDLYQLGSLAVFFFSRVMMTHLVISHLRDEHRPGVWSGSFEDVLPYLHQATAGALDQFRSDLSKGVRIPELVDRLNAQIAYLCDPDPRRRGHPTSHVGVLDPYSLVRFVSSFDLLASRAEWIATRSEA